MARSERGRLRCISPADGGVYVERELANGGESAAVRIAALEAPRDWRHVPIDERRCVTQRAIECFIAKRDLLAEEISRLGQRRSDKPLEMRKGTWT